MILPGLEFYPCNTNEGFDSEAVVLLLTRDGSILCPRDRDTLLWDASEIKFAMPPAVSEHFLGIFRGRPCYCQEVSSPEEFTLPHKISPLFGLLGKINDTQFNLAGRALQIINWYQDHRFCGRCGTRTRIIEEERAAQCDKCGLLCYPRVSPCIIVLVTRGDQCLLALNAAWKDNPMYSSLAGFMEAGETVEETINREVYEEVGVVVGKPQYFGSQPWPFPGQLMLGFHAEYESGEVRIDDKEIVEAGWWRYDNLPNCPPPSSIAGRLIKRFVDSHQRS